MHWENMLLDSAPEGFQILQTTLHSAISALVVEQTGEFQFLLVNIPLAVIIQQFIPHSLMDRNDSKALRRTPTLFRDLDTVRVSLRTAHKTIWRQSFHGLYPDFRVGSGDTYRVVSSKSRQYGPDLNLDADNLDWLFKYEYLEGHFKNGLMTDVEIWDCSGSMISAHCQMVAPKISSISGLYDSSFDLDYFHLLQYDFTISKAIRFDLYLAFTQGNRILVHEMEMTSIIKGRCLSHYE